ncbi:hypothetical protein R1flu_017707 [Riccia fluitans]|uniref:Glutathione reductase n=1 Tax=Riccia fluitans TaxID=41844 RepID=A0ABD1ZHR4_9MARC
MMAVVALPKCMVAALGVGGIARGAFSEQATNSVGWVQSAVVGKSLRWSFRGRTRRESVRSISSLNLRAAAASSEGNGAAGDSKDGDYDYDLVTIGGGSGGVRASRFAANLGAKVAVCELPFSTIASDTTGGVGGTCVLRGCVPKKILVYGSQFGHNFEESKGFGWSYDSKPKHNWRTLVDNKNKELQRLVGVYKNILKNNDVTLIEGRGKILDPHTVDISGKRVRARNILVAVGGRALVPDIPGKEHVITSDEALDLPSRPEKICIVGGGYIALEFATIFSGLGSEVHVFVRQDKVLRGFDEEIREFLADQMALKGVNFHFGESPTAVEKGSDGKFTLVTTKGSEVADLIMFATGRKANTKNLGLEEVGVQVDKKGSIQVDEYSRTSVPSIWAVGDVTDRVNLTPVALMEGMAFANTAIGNKPTKPDHRYIASAVFTQPPIGTVGLTEAEALDLYGDIDVYTSSFRPMKATISGLGNRTFMKIIVDASSDVVVGVHMCGDDSAEIMQGFGVAVKAQLTKAQFDATVGIHPTAAEELVTMRSPTRKLRRTASQKVSAGGAVPAV